jgi:sugar phosphate isomerase/epimerase
MSNAKRNTGQVHRRDFVKRSAGMAAAGAVGLGGVPLLSASDPVISKGRVNQSIAYWCFNVAGDEWNIEQQCEVAKKLGCKSVELVDHKDFGVLKKHGLVCAISPNGMPGAPFMKGLNNPRYQDEVVMRTLKAIDANADAGCPNVIAFNGYKWHDAEDASSGEIPKDEGARNCVKALKKLALQAEKKDVTVCLEQLNTRDDTHPMKGHPGYQGDHIDYVADIIKAVGSPNVKLLFDIYHVQVMDGDIIRRIQEYHELIGHVHTAGNPGRCEIDAEQEINFAACMKALLKAGYTGFVGHEYIPTRDAMGGLTEAVAVCDV